MALKMATELDEPAVDLEGALTANTITASQNPDPTGGGMHLLKYLFANLCLMFFVFIKILFQNIKEPKYNMKFYCHVSTILYFSLGIFFKFYKYRIYNVRLVGN